MSPFAALAAGARRWSDQPLFARPVNELTFGEAFDNAEAFAEQLSAAGYQAGQRIGLALGNGSEFFQCLLGANGIGVSVVPVAADWTSDERERQLEAAGICALIAAEPQPRVGGIPVGTAAALPSPLPRATAWADEAALIFTSGTTGEPKRCVLSNRYFVRAGAHYAGLGGLCAFRPKGERILTPLPVTHMNALVCSFMAALSTGSALISLDRFRASTWWETVRQSRATVVHYLGVMPAILLQHPPSPCDRDHAVRFGFGAGVDPRHHAAFEARFGFPLIEAWAMTETGAGAWITAADEPRHVGTRCFGRPGAEVAVRIAREDGEAAEVDEPGELLVRAAGQEPRDGFFSGYDGDPVATEAAWAGGWFHSGDIVRRGPDGSLVFVDRAKNIIRRSGENIAAVEVEGVLLVHPEVAACAVLPVEDEIRGEEVMALVVAANGAAPDPAALHGWAAERLAYFKAPGWIAFVDSLPTTGSQKLQRGVVRALGRELLTAGRAHDLRPLKRRA